jgi:hypothetical protein
MTVAGYVLLAILLAMACSLLALACEPKELRDERLRRDRR